ncbi:DUF1080 domain-containing protein [Sungkyunkwania multivorans]|uniref:DUF1080 domain-containing protein n=1 Tax=Sungkyunkwania multivorans TaxID=1173618 RepID=A0ABW3D1A9_9FLAO
MKNIYLPMICLFLFCACNHAQNNGRTKESVTQQDQKKEPTDPKETEVWEPEPKKISFDKNGIPSDAIVLFNGEDLDAWESAKNEGEPAKWIINEDGSMTVKDKSGDIKTKQDFGSVQLHIEWRNPADPRADGQNRGNSGIFLQDRYEVQVLDSYGDNRTYANGQAASVYKQYSPLVNANRPSGEWQVYDIIFHAPEFDSQGNKIKSGTLTVLHNGILVQDHVEILGTTEYIGWPKNVAHGKAPLKLQDHNDNSGVSYRNIWLREL